jgi:hypothetical protein
VRTPQYEAVVDGKDGCLSSLRIGGVEFLKNGATLAKGKSFARGAYFFHKLDGYEGLVPLPRIEQPAAHTIVATGEKFSIRYDFGPETLTLTGQNCTDDTVPFYLIFDTATVHEVINAGGEQHAVPLTPADILDPKWKKTTWIAGRARLKVSDQTENGQIRMWGPFSEFRSQVWGTQATTYNHCKVVLEPSIGPELARPVLAPGGVLVTRQGFSRRIVTEWYEAVIDEDGCMPSLRVEGIEVLRSGVGVSRGLYFFQEKTRLQLPDVRQPAANTITAQGEQAAIRYEFASSRMTWAIENRTDKVMAFFAVLDPAVTAARNDKGEWSKVPLVQLPTGPPDPRWAITWFAGWARMKMTGGTRVWGPWMDRYQVWEASLAPKEKRSITVEVGLTNPAEAAKVDEVTGSKTVPAADLTLESPLDYQVFQRHTKFKGALAIRGRVRSAHDRLEVRVLGRSLQGPLPDQWQELPMKERTRTFDAALPAPAGGWYRVEVRATREGKMVGQAAVEHVGIGEVFVGAGQSNSTNCSDERIKQTSGLVSTFSGSDWRLADDPQPGVHDDTKGGSYWPAFGDEMVARYQVPIGIASTGHSGTSINQWQPGGELFRWTTGRMNQLGREGFRGVLWHQGESDVGMPPEEYAHKLTALVQDSRSTAGWAVPWFVAQVSYHNPGQTSFPNPRAGQKKLWETGIAFEGPDTDTLTGDNRDQGGKGIHFSPKGQRAHGKMWADKVAVYLDRELGK